MFRCFRFALRRGRLLALQAEMEEDACYDNGVINQADDFHLMPAAGTTPRGDFPDLLDQLRPRF